MSICTCGDEWSCYSTLLVHIRWPWGGEEEILRGYDSAVECSYILKLSDDIPQYVNYTLELLHNSNVIRDNVGVNINEVDEESDEFLYNNCSDENNFIVEDSNLSQISDSIRIPLNPNNNNIDSVINITAANMRYCKIFIQRVQNKHLEALKFENSIQSTLSNDELSSHSDIYYKVNNFDERFKKLEDNVSRLTKQQLFVTGEGGTGK